MPPLPWPGFSSFSGSRILHCFAVKLGAGGERTWDSLFVGHMGQPLDWVVHEARDS